MPRYNVFLMIHKGLRAFMYDVSVNIQHTNFATAGGFPHSLEKLENLLDTFDKHGHHEDEHIFNMLAACNPQLQAEMEQEHVTDHALSDKLRTLTERYRNTSDTAEHIAIGSEIAYALNDFIAFNLTHLNKEEIVVNASLWQHYTDEDILAANMRMIATLSPEEVQHSATWMMRGCNDAELSGWLSNIKKQAPPPVFDLLLGIAQAQLPAHRFEQIQNSILETALP